MLINRDTAAAMDAAITITANTQYSSGRVWAVVPDDSSIQELAPISASSITANAFHYTIPKMSVCHIVLQSHGASGIAEENIPASPTLSIAPNPTAGAVTIVVPAGVRAGAVLTIYDMLGNTRAAMDKRRIERTCNGTAGRERAKCRRACTGSH